MNKNTSELLLVVPAVCCVVQRPLVSRPVSGSGAPVVREVHEPGAVAVQPELLLN